MKVLLINTPIDRHDILGNFQGIYKDMIMLPTGIAHLAGFMRQAGIDVRVIDEYALLLPIPEVVAQIRGFGPDLIGYSATTPNYFAAIEMAREVKKHISGVPVLFGGIHPSIFPEEVLKDPIVDYVIRDEAEMPLLGLCEALQGKRAFESILGLSFKTLSGRVHNPRTPPVQLDQLPFPAYDLLPMNLYSSPSYTKFATPVYQMVASRGCPFACSYCVNAESNVAARYRRRSLDRVIEEMELLADRFGARQIQFWDPVFPLGEKHAFEFCTKVIERGLHKRVVWNCTTRPDILSESVIKMMVKAGCKGVGFGIESGVPELLARVNKRLELDKIRSACRIATKNGLLVMSGFIIGMPGETPEMTQRTINFAKSLDLHYAQFSVLVPYPGTPLYRELKAAGEIDAATENDFVRYNQSVGLTDKEPVWIPKGRTASELKAWQKKAYVQFYLRPRMIWMHLPHLKWSKIAGMVRAFAAVLGLAVQRLGDRIRGENG